MLKKSFYCLSLFILALGMAACGSKNHDHDHDEETEQHAGEDAHDHDHDGDEILLTQRRQKLPEWRLKQLCREPFMALSIPAVKCCLHHATRPLSLPQSAVVWHTRIMGVKD